MRSFFETPDKKSRNRLLAGDLAWITINFYLCFILAMYVQGTLKPFLVTIGNLPPFARGMAIVDVVIFFTAVFLLLGAVHIGIYHLSGLYRVQAVPDLRKTAIRLVAAILFAILIIFAILTTLSTLTFPAPVWAFHAGTLFIALFTWRFFYINKRVANHPYRIMIIGTDDPSRDAAMML